jgi:hypothetical protein
MEKLNQSFRQHLGLRGVHLYSCDGCRFLPWSEVLTFLKRLPPDLDPDLEETLLTAMSNYDPNFQFLAVQQKEDSISIELYTATKL